MTACAFVVITVRGSDPQHGEESGSIAILARHGIPMIIGELALLAILYSRPIPPTNFWSRRRETRGER